MNKAIETIKINLRQGNTTLIMTEDYNRKNEMCRVEKRNVQNYSFFSVARRALELQLNAD